MARKNWEAIGAVGSLVGGIASLLALTGVMLAWCEYRKDAADKTAARLETAKAYVISVAPRLAEARGRVQSMVQQLDALIAAVNEENKAQTYQSAQRLFAGPFQNLGLSQPFELYVKNAEALREANGGPFLGAAYAAHEQLLFTGTTVANSNANARSLNEVKEDLTALRTECVTLATELDQFAERALHIHPTMTLNDWHRSAAPH